MSTPTNSPADISDREILLSRVFHAPRELVWEAMTDPKHVVNWWGPRGFTTTIETMDFRVGGVWKHTMHGPDGANYPNKSVFREIVKPERIVYSHGGGREGGPGASFVATWTFEVVDAGRTKVTMRLVFASAGDRDFVVKEFGAIEGGQQTLMRLGEHLARQQAEPFVVVREFAAPRTVVWQAWTERDRLVQWWGPKGFTMPIATMDFRVGGMFHYRMLAPNGAEMWGKFAYREIVAPTKLLWVNSFSDPDGGITSHPFSTEPWPRQILTEVTFAEHNAQTAVTVTMLPLDATEAELKVFNAHHGSMNQGWGGTLEQLTDYLAAG